MPLLAALLALASPLPPTQVGAVEVPFRKGETNMVVEALVNGRKVSLLFDSGYSADVVMNSSVNVGPTMGAVTVTDFVGQTSMNTVKLKSLKVGPKTIAIASDAHIMQQDADFSDDDGRIDGILGFSAFKDSPFTIDFQHSKLIFHPKGYDVTTRKADNKKTFMEKLAPIGHSSLEMFVKTADGKSMTMALDTGNANYATTHPDILERIGLWNVGKEVKYTHLGYIASGPVESFSIKMPQLTIFGIPTPPTVWDVINVPSATAEGDGTVGYGFLKHFNITIDYPRRRVFFENWDAPYSNEESAEVGLVALTNPEVKRVLVYNVTPGGPADLAGIKRLDTILSVDGEDLDRVSYQKFRKMMEGKAGTSVKLVYSHNGSLKRTELKRTLLVNDALEPAKAAG